MGKMLELVIPEGVSFSDLQVQLKDDGALGYDLETLSQLAIASGLEEDFFERQDDDLVLSIILGWYLAHRQLGGHACPIMEELQEGGDLQARYGAAYAGMPHTIQ